MRSTILSLLAVCAGIVVAVLSAQAQAPVYGETINLEQARKAVDGAVAEAKKNDWMLAITVVGPSGDLVYFAEDGQPPVRFDYDLAAQGAALRLSAVDQVVRGAHRRRRHGPDSTDARAA